MKTATIAFALTMVSTSTFAAGLTLACKGKFEARGTGDPIVAEVTASVVVEPNHVSVSLHSEPCPITSNRPNGVDFQCPMPKLAGGWFWSRTGYLDRFTGDLSVLTVRTPPPGSDKFGSTETYDLSCKPAARMF